MKGNNYANKLSIKLISVGDVEVGKSCLIKRYCEGSFVSDYITTIGIDTIMRNVELKSDEKGEYYLIEVEEVI